MAVGLLIAATGPWLLTWKDNIRQLEIPSPTLHRNDLEIRERFGQGPGTIVYLTQGATPAEARDAWSRFSAWHQARHGTAQPIFSIAEVVPTQSEWDRMPERLAGLGDFEGALKTALERHGFDEEAFAPFFKAWRAWTDKPRPHYDGLVRGFAASMHGPSALLLSFAPGASWYASIISQRSPEEPPRDLHTLSTSQLETLNQVFARYRESALHLSLVGLGLLGLSVLAMYGPRRGIRVFAIPAGACLCSFGLLGLLGEPLNLFHLLGAFLGVCLSHNYAIFSTENSLRGEGVPPSIRLSGLTTALSFGVLAFSHIPVVAALGTTVSLEVAFALVIVELEAFVPASGTGPRTRPEAVD